MIRFQSHLLSASMCSSMTACGVDCLLSGGSFRSSADAIDDPMSKTRRATPISLNIAFLPLTLVLRAATQPNDFSELVLARRAHDINPCRNPHWRFVQ